MNSSAGVVCLAICAGIVVAGLWPFHAPTNEMRWLDDKNGVLLSGNSLLVSSSLVLRPKSRSSCAIQLWLKPQNARSSSTVISFYGPNKRAVLSIRQSNPDLSVRVGGNRFYVDHVFASASERFLTITSSQSGTEVFGEDRLLKRNTDLPIPCSAFLQPFVVGTSLVQNDSWSGELRGVAMYENDLSPERIRTIYLTWTGRTGLPDVKPADRLAALYLFNERKGVLVHNSIAWGQEISIPSHFQLVSQRMLNPPWQGFRWEWSYTQDVVLNILGFVPFGFMVSAWAKRRLSIRQLLLLVPVLGFLFSVTIEVVQAHLPTRHSDMTDVITNTVGAYAGVILFRSWTKARQTRSAGTSASRELTNEVIRTAAT